MNDIKPRLEQYITQLRGILQNLENFKNQFDPNQKLGEEIISKGIGMLVEELSESSTVGKFGRKWANNKMKMEKKQQQKQSIANQEFNFHSILEQIKNFLNAVSIEKANLKPIGNSNLLLKKFASVENYSKLETKVRRSIAILNQINAEPLIYNTKIQQVREQQKVKIQAEYYQVLKNLEQELRKLIQTKLSKISKHWWNQNVPDDVQENAERRKKQNERPWSWLMRGEYLVDYIDFTDYAKIITRRDNWNQVFKEIFHNKEELSAKLKELEPIRNAIMHSRNLTAKQKQRLQLYSDDILDIIKNM